MWKLRELRGVAFRRVCCFAAAAMYQEQVPSFKHDEPLDEAGLSLNVFWQGISKPLLSVDSALSCSRDCTVHLFGLAFFLEILFLVTK